MGWHEQSRLWRQSLGPDAPPDHPDARERLRAAYGAFRDRASLLASEIPRHLPTFTRHDDSHLDAIWELADMIGGPELSLAPTEAFVFGGAVLLHDLGLAVASFAGESADLRKEPEWGDALALELTRQLGRSPTPEELADPGVEAEESALGRVLRMRHAERAEKLAFAEWEDRDGRVMRLLESEHLARAYGPLIGRIAHSHWWSIDRLAREFRTTAGAPADYPTGWTVDPLKLACLLRVADAAHLDASRAPALLRAVRGIDGYSEQHWAFQERLRRPTRVGDRLSYTSGTPFPKHDADAWWLGLEALRVADRELRSVDSLLVETKRPRFAARGVLAVEDPERLAGWVETDGWVPVDAAIQVSDVPSLVERFGGSRLYGNADVMPLRELLQNGFDAVQARRSLQGRGGDWGTVRVSIIDDARGRCIEVADTGVGMNREVLTGPLLDFGSSYWESSRVAEDLPGLLSSRFEPIGQFGIGFFAALLWGDEIEVTSQRYDASQVDTFVLELRGGARSRPLVRRAERHEYLADAGTRVRVWLEPRPISQERVPGGTLRVDALRLVSSADQLAALCAWLCPAAEVDVVSAVGDDPPAAAVRAGDWHELDAVQLIRRVAGRELPNLERLAPNLRPLVGQDGNQVGRAALIPGWEYFEAVREPGCLTSGGLRAAEQSGIAGLVKGEPANIARSEATSTVSERELARWATEQAPLISAAYGDIQRQILAAGTIYAMGGDPGPLAICFGSNDRGLTPAGVLRLAASNDVVMLLTDFVNIECEGQGDTAHIDPDEVELLEHVLAMEERAGRGVPPLRSARAAPDRSLEMLIVSLCAQAWSTSVAQVAACSHLWVAPNRAPVLAVGRYRGASLKASPDMLIVRPPRDARTATGLGPDGR